MSTLSLRSLSIIVSRRGRVKPGVIDSNESNGQARICGSHATATISIFLALTGMARSATPWSVTAAAFLAVVAPVQSQQSDGGSTTFDQVANILNEKCVVCHSGPDAPLGLQLDSLEHLKAGSLNGPVAIPSNPSESEIIRRIKGISQPQMPLTGPPFLNEQEIALFERWIADGMIEAAAGEPPPPATSATTPPRDEDGDQVLFSHVERIFLQRCIECHSDANPQGPPEGLRLGSLEQILAGSDRVVVVPGNAGASELIRRVRGLSLPRMPFDGPPFLTDDQIQLLADWIEQGARDNEGIPAPVPVGREVRLEGTLTRRWMLDETDFLVNDQTRIDDNPQQGETVEVRGEIAEDGSILATRIRER